MNEVEKALDYCKGRIKSFEKVIESNNFFLQDPTMESDKKRLKLEIEIEKATKKISHYTAMHNALEKQIKKKVIVETEDDREYIDFICPYCENTIEQARKGQKYNLYKPKYHDNCGQALDWSETK
jgi:uncharacterized protein YcgI (DUF1989 family)